MWHLGHLGRRQLVSDDGLHWKRGESSEQGPLGTRQAVDKQWHRGVRLQVWVWGLGTAVLPLRDQELGPSKSPRVCHARVGNQVFPACSCRYREQGGGSADSSSVTFKHPDRCVHTCATSCLGQLDNHNGRLENLTGWPHLANSRHVSTLHVCCLFGGCV